MQLFVHGVAARRVRIWAGLLVVAIATVSARAAVLPEDRADATYHYYDGGGTEVNGPSLLVRKGIGDVASVYGYYYQDAISGASIDVVTTASPYKEKRNEYGIGADFLRRNTLVNFSYSNSDEPDYLSEMFGVKLSHELFDAMTTVSLGYRVGHDTVLRTGTDFQDYVDRWQYTLGLSQVFTRRLVMSLAYDSTLDDGYLNSPYRGARLNGLLVPERYPRTRDSNALALRGVYGFSTNEGRLSSSLRAGYRYFWDTWQIQAHTLEVAYQRYFGSRWIGEANFRYYSQTAASFYSDNFTQSQVYMARDKELSTFDSYGLGIKGTWWFYRNPSSQRRASLNFTGNRVYYDYKDFTDVRNGQLYSFEANIMQVYVSLWY